MFLAVTDSAAAPEPHERQRAIELARRWAPEAEAPYVSAMVDTAYVAVRSGVDVEAIAEELCEKLSREACLRLVSDLGRIAQADGHLSLHEAQMIARVRAAIG